MCTASVGHVICVVRTASFGHGFWPNCKNKHFNSLRNFGSRLPIDTASHPRRAGCSKVRNVATLRVKELPAKRPKTLLKNDDFKYTASVA